MSQFKEYSDEALMVLLQKGTTSALDELYHRYSKKLLGLMYRMLSCNEALAQDLLHDTFIKIMENPDAFDNSRSFKPWIYTIASNACKRSYRQKETRDLDALNNDARHATELGLNLDASHISGAIAEAVNSLSYEHKEVVVLRHQQALSIKEISAITLCAEGTVKSRLFTARKILATKLKDYHPNSIL